MRVRVALAAETSHFLALFPLSFTPPSLSSGCNDELMLPAWMQSELIAQLLIHLSSALAGKAGQSVYLDRPGYSLECAGENQLLCRCTKFHSVIWVNSSLCFRMVLVTEVAKVNTLLNNHQVCQERSQITEESKQCCYGKM